MQINDAKNPCQIWEKNRKLEMQGWFEDVQQGEWSALKQLYCFLNGHLTTACRPCNHPLGRALTKSRARVCKGLSIYYVIRDGGAGVFPIYYNIT